MDPLVALAADDERLATALDDIRGAVREEFGSDYLAGHDHLHPQTARRD